MTRLKKSAGILMLLILLGLGRASASETHMTLKVYLDTQGENVNTFGGTLVLPKNWTVENVSLNSLNSIYWIQTPSVKTPPQLTFSGIFPGGIQQVDASASKPLLFSIDFSGMNSTDSIYFENSEFYLNHPAALPAEKTSFSYEIHTVGNSDLSQNTDGLLDLVYSFEDDPITKQPVLVINSTEGKLAAYQFQEKEGDLNFNTWLAVDGVQSLMDDDSTVVLSAMDMHGSSTILTIRQSFFRRSFIILGSFIFTLFSLYLLYSAYQILRLRPDKP